jgi:HD-like signal output (HDOD) protein
MGAMADINEFRVLLRRKIKLNPVWADLPRLIQLSEQEDIALSQLEPIVDRNPGLAANMLRIANSAHMGNREPIVTIHHAIVALGLRTVRSIALSALHFTLNKMQRPVRGFDAAAFCKRSHALALVCRKRSERLSNILLAESGFEAGLFQELGYLVLLEERPDLLSLLIGAARQMPHTDIYEIEPQILGFTHAELGALLAEEWGFPEHLIEAIRWHHEPLKASPEYAPLVDRAHYASWFAYQAKLPPFPGTGGHDLNDLVLSRIQQSQETGVELAPPSPEEVADVVQTSTEATNQLMDAA